MDTFYGIVGKKELKRNLDLDLNENTLDGTQMDCSGGNMKHTTNTEITDLHQRARGSPKVPIVRYPNAGPGLSRSMVVSIREDNDEIDVKNNVNVNVNSQEQVLQSSKGQSKVVPAVEDSQRSSNMSEELVSLNVGKEKVDASASRLKSVDSSKSIASSFNSNDYESNETRGNTVLKSKQEMSLDTTIPANTSVISKNTPQHRPKVTSYNRDANTSKNVIDLTDTTMNNEERTCLTWPKDAVANNGLDNQDGYLIVHTTDILVANSDGGVEVTNWLVSTGAKVSTVTKTADLSPDITCRKLDESLNINEYPTRYEVFGVLGQGTFAQVFKCKNMDNEEMVAIKIVKNKPAYVRQAAIEVDIFRALGADTCRNKISNAQKHSRKADSDERVSSEKKGDGDTDLNLSMVHLRGYFKFANHLCLVFDLLGPNLYEVLKRRQFRGLPLPTVRSLVHQSMNSLKELAKRHVVHCDLKPENILLQDQETMQQVVDAVDISPNLRNMSRTKPKIRLIDFGSACFEGRSTHTYIQSRFYRSPEVLLGLPYDSSIDMWSLGCVSAELFLGLPILPGIHEHDQLLRIAEMIAPIPDWMLDEGTKTKKYFTSADPSYQRYPLLARHHPSLPLPPDNRSPPLSVLNRDDLNATSKWRLKSREEYNMYVEHERNRNTYGGGKSASAENTYVRYFKSKRLEDIIFDHGRAHFSNASPLEQRALMAFVHFLKCVLEPNPWKRLTGLQALNHPFLTETFVHDENPTNQTSLLFTRGISDWKAPWDPTIWERKKLYDRKKKQKYQNNSNTAAVSSCLTNAVLPLNTTANLKLHPLNQSLQSHQGQLVRGDPVSPEFSTVTSRVTAMTDAMSLSQQQQQQQQQQHHQQGALPLNTAYVPRPSPPSFAAEQELNPPLASSFMPSPTTQHYVISSSQQMPMLSSSLAGYMPQTPQQQRLPKSHMYNASIPSSNPIHMYQHASSWMGSDAISDMEMNSNAPSILNQQTYAMHISTPGSVDPTLQMHLARNSSNFRSSLNNNGQYMYGAPSGAMPPPPSTSFPMPMHAQSYSDAYSSYGNRQLNDDFGYALQRPGVLPATNDPYGNNNNDWRQQLMLQPPANFEAIDGTALGLAAFENMHHHDQQQSSSFQPSMMYHNSPYNNKNLHHGTTRLSQSTGLLRKSYSETMDTSAVNNLAISPFIESSAVGVSGDPGRHLHTQGSSLLTQQLAMADHNSTQYTANQAFHNNSGYMHPVREGNNFYDHSQQHQPQHFDAPIEPASFDQREGGYNNNVLLSHRRNSFTEHAIMSKAVVSDGELTNHSLSQVSVNMSHHMNLAQQQPQSQENQMPHS